MDNNTNRNTGSAVNYPTSLTMSIIELNEVEGFRVNDILESYQFLYRERQLASTITWNMRGKVLELLTENGAPRVR